MSHYFCIFRTPFVKTKSLLSRTTKYAEDIKTSMSGCAVPLQSIPHSLPLQCRIIVYVYTPVVNGPSGSSKAAETSSNTNIYGKLLLLYYLQTLIYKFMDFFSFPFIYLWIFVCIYIVLMTFLHHSRSFIVYTSINLISVGYQR